MENIQCYTWFSTKHHDERELFKEEFVGTERSSEWVHDYRGRERISREAGAMALEQYLRAYIDP